RLGRGHLEPRLAVVVIDPHQPPPRALGLGRTTQRLGDARRGAQHLDLRRIDLARALERRQRLAGAAGAEARGTLEPQRAPVVRVARQCPLRELERAARLAELRAELADAHEQVHRAWVERERAVVLVARLAQLAGLLE